MMQPISAPVNRILPLSTVDGPGARASIFLQGCNIACLYCHNPETQQMCRHCGLCVGKCPTGALQMQQGKVVWDEALCVNCDTCLKVCPFNASPKIHWMQPQEVLDAVLPNRPFIRGITVSGGECTLYPDFLTQLFTLAQAQGLTCLLDSNGTVDLEQLPQLMQVTNGVMLDVKAWDAGVYKDLCGAEDNSMVKKNLAFLLASDKLQEVRIVYMPGHVDAQAAIEGVAHIAGSQVGNVRLKLIAFRCHGVRGMAEKAAQPTKEEMENLRKSALEAGFAHIQVV